MNRWIGRTALVTGAADGIGTFLCSVLVQHGMTVLGCDRNVTELRELRVPHPDKFHVWRCDMSIESDILAMYDYIRTTFGSVAVSIDNGICCIKSPLTSGKSGDWRYMMKDGVEGTSISAREAVRLMKEYFVEDGQIIQVGSLGRPKLPVLRKDIGKKPTEAYNLYSGMRVMNRALAEGLRQELRAKKSGIRVTTVSLSSVDNELFTRSLNSDIARTYFATCGYIHPSDVVEAVLHVLETPAHVNVNDIILDAMHLF